MKYKSKIDWWAHIAFALMPIANIWIIAAFVLNQSIVSAVCAIIFLILNVFLIVPLWFNTYYILEDDGLLVKCGLGKGTKIAYSSIKSIRETKEPLASAALSLDRISISYGVGGYILISPINKQDFIQNLEQQIKVL